MVSSLFSPPEESPPRKEAGTKISDSCPSFSHAHEVKKICQALFPGLDIATHRLFSPRKWRFIDGEFSRFA